MKKILLSVTALVILLLQSEAADFKTDFEEKNIKIGIAADSTWRTFDENSLGDQGPSSWEIKKGEIKGNALSQSSNIWGDKTDTVAIGTVAVYTKQKWIDFVLDVDVLANDNDGMGVVWRFQDLSEHYRFFTMVDSGNPPNGERGPWRKLEVRLGKGAGQKLPFYDTLDIEKGKSYTEGKLTHWKIEVTGDRFRVEVDGKKAVEGKDNTHDKAGYIGFILYAQSGVFFDNLVITDTFPVNPQDAFTTTWSQIKKLRLKNQ